MGLTKWILKNPKVDYENMSRTLGVSELICRVLVNRKIYEQIDAMAFISPELNMLYNPRLMKDLGKAADIIKDKITSGKKIRIVGDYDVDGVISTYILMEALTHCGALVDYDIPHRVHDGYGINVSIVEKAYKDGIDTIITCDNGIAAIDQIKHAKQLGMTVIVTDHHEVPFVVCEDGSRCHVIPDADAVVDCKQTDCNYPFKLLCGAAVAFKLVQVLFEEFQISKDIEERLYEMVAIATVCDVVDLVSENRIFVKKGLKTLSNTKNPGLLALLMETGIHDKELSVYHLGFIIGPCINASGRLECARKGLEMLLCKNIDEAIPLARELAQLNAQRKSMTQEGIEEVCAAIESSDIKNDKVFIVYNNNIHESIAGIIAGKIRERYNVPTLVLTDSENGVKGSGRSIEEYNMFEELLACRDLLDKFGGHPMAAGLSLPYENIELLRRAMNENTTLTEDDLVPKLYIDAQVPIETISLSMAQEISILEPYGKGNSKPVFADKNVAVTRATVIGANKNVLKLKLSKKTGKSIDAIYFGNIEDFDSYIATKFGENEKNLMYEGKINNVVLDLAFNIDINQYNNMKSVQLVVQNFR